MKKLNVKAVVIDLRHVSEETLASYEHIQIHAALAMTSPSPCFSGRSAQTACEDLSYDSPS